MRVAPTFGQPEIGDDWVRVTWGINGDTPAKVRVYKQPGNYVTDFHEYDPWVNTYTWPGLPGGRPLTLYVSCVYPGEELRAPLDVPPLGGFVPVPQGRPAKPTNLRVIDGSTDHVNLRWTNPRSYLDTRVGWQSPGIDHQQIDLPGNATTATIRDDFRPGIEYRLKVQGRGEIAPFVTPTWSEWTEIAWKYPTPGPSWLQRNQEKLYDVYLVAWPAAVSWGPNRIDVFHGVKGNNRLLGHTWWDGGPDFLYEERDVGAPGEMYGFAAATRGPGRLDVFYNSERQLWHLVYDGTGWHDPKPVDGAPLRPGTPLAAISWGGDRLDVFYRGQNGQLIQRFHENGDWSGEVDLGGIVEGRPAAASWGPGRLDVFYRGTDSQLHWRWWDGGPHWGHKGLGGAVKGDVAAISWGGDRLDVFSQGQANDRLFQRFHENGRWSGEIDLGQGPTVNLHGLTVASWAPARLDLFYSNMLARPVALWHHWYSG